MLLVSYDISDNKVRTKFAKFLSKFGHRLQYSVFEIDNSDRFIEIISAEIENRFKHYFNEADSVMIFKMTSSCEIIRYGYAKKDDEELIIIV